MYELIEATGPDDRRRLVSLPPDLTADDVERQGPDSSWMAVNDAGDVAARCSLWWRRTPPLPGHRLGLIGHYAAQNNTAARQLLLRACDLLSEQGCTLAVGPMDGSTWERYRLITKRGAEPAFFMEPENPDAWPGHFTSCGFAPLARYHSALSTDLTHEDVRLAETARRLEADGVRLRPLDMDRFEEELRAIGSLCLASFRDNFMYSPITEEEFIARYLPMTSFVRPELIILAEQQGKLIGLNFGIPDLNQEMRGQPIDTVLIKTVAVHPGHAGKGLASLLMARCQRAAHELGYRRAIHALFHEANKTGKISRHTARLIRTYALFGRTLFKNEHSPHPA